MNKITNQKTIFSPFSISGTGLHSGRKANMSFSPAPANYGIKFRRMDLPGSAVIEAVAENVTDTARGTTIASGDASVATVEHLLAAVSALGIDNLLIEIDECEIPILDGSAVEFYELLQSAGLFNLKARRNFYSISETISYEDTDRGVLISADPAPQDISFSCEVDYNTSVLGVQQVTLSGFDGFRGEIANARTFVFLHEMEALLRHNLIKGGSFENAIVIVDREIAPDELRKLAAYFNQNDIRIAPQGILNNTSLRFPDEPARHKLLDMIGDISLVGFPLLGKISGLRPGHAANVAFAKKLRSRILQEKAEQRFRKDTSRTLQENRS